MIASKLLTQFFQIIQLCIYLNRVFCVWVVSVFQYLYELQLRIISKNFKVLSIVFKKSVNSKTNYLWDSFILAINWRKEHKKKHFSGEKVNQHFRGEVNIWNLNKIDVAIKSLHVSSLFLYPLKTSENHWLMG